MERRVTSGAASRIGPEHRVVVVGAGIIGASVAYHLAIRGVAVTLMDAGLPASGATGSSFGWIGGPRVDPMRAASLRELAVAEYHRLAAELPHLPIDWSGSLTWGRSTEAPRAGVTVDDVGAREPRLTHPPDTALHAAADGACDPAGVTEELVSAAIAQGAQLRTGTPVTRVLRAGSAVTGVRTTEEDVPADAVVLAAGVGTAAVAAGVGFDVPIGASPALLVRLRARPGLIRSILDTPAVEIRQEGDGTLLVPCAHNGETTRAQLDATAQKVRRTVIDTVEGLDDVEILSVEIGWRPMPADGEPIIGHVRGLDGLYLAVMHSGVTLAAAVGRLAAQEIVTGSPQPELAGCRLPR